MPRLKRLVGSPAFDAVILAVIVANAVVLGLQTYPDLVERYGNTLDLLNGVFLAVFVVELLLRIASYGRRPQDFFRNGWNVFDFFVVSAAFLPGVRESSTMLRLARLLRVVRVVRFLPDVRVLLVAVVRSLPPLFSLVTLTVLLLFVYGMVGWLLFADELPEDWGTIGAGDADDVHPADPRELPDVHERRASTCTRGRGSTSSASSWSPRSSCSTC